MKFIRGLFVCLLLLLLFFYNIDQRGYRGPATNNFDGHQFLNMAPIADKGLVEFLRWQFTSEPGEWHYRDIEPVGAFPVQRNGPGQLRANFINHATVLLQIDGVNVLTDPIWSEFASTYPYLGPRRYHEPGIRLQDLPPIDLVLISHSHYDHLDLATLKQLQAHSDPLILMGLGNAYLLEGAGLTRFQELNWWEGAEVMGLRINSVPAQHASMRASHGYDRTLWAGYVIEGQGGPVFFAGDTGYGPHYEHIREFFGPMRLSLLPIGAYKPRWFMRDNHMSPADALQAYFDLESAAGMGIHFGTFNVADDGQYEAAEEMTRLLAEGERIDISFWIPEPGESKTWNQ